MHGILKVMKGFINGIKVAGQKALPSLGVQLREDWSSRVLIQSPVASQRAFRIRVLLIAGLGVAAAVAVFFLPPIAQDPAYHNFADQREIWGVPNLFNVISNAPYVLVGALGLLFLLRDGATETPGPFLDSRQRTPFLVLFAGIFLTGFGSAYYHLAPSNATLFWDRLPMTMVFMSLFAIVIAERISIRAGHWLLLPLLAAGIGSIVYSQIRELKVGGDLRFYLLVQFFPLLAIPLMLLFFPPKYTRSSGLFWMVGLYALAKIFERFDTQLFAQGGFVSGHTIKHLLSAMAIYSILRMLRSRRLVESPVDLKSVRNHDESRDYPGLLPRTPAYRARNDLTGTATHVPRRCQVCFRSDSAG
ncbi:MAG TPA: ceramidase domain-containing protein [Acidobacteriota bacterium]